MAMGESLDIWFKRDVLVHEEALTRFIRQRWSNSEDVSDLRQETYARLYKLARKGIPQPVRPLLFSIAKHLMTDKLRQRRIVVIDSVGDCDGLNVLVDEISPESRLNGHQELRELAKALDQLPQQCRKVVWMRRVDDLSQRDVAKRLGVSEKTVEKHLAKGIKRLIDTVLGTVRALEAGDERPVQRQKHGKQRQD